MPTITPDIPLVLSHITSQEPPLLNPRRNGKIARLPKEARDMINHMLDDGLPYHIIIDELGEAGEGLNPQNLTNWVQGGYQDYLRHQDFAERFKIQMEFTADLLREMGDVDPAAVQRACQYVAGLQILQLLRDHGDEALRRMVEAQPAKYLTVVNTSCKLSNSSLKQEKQRTAAELNRETVFTSTVCPTPTPQAQPGRKDIDSPVPQAQSSQIKVVQAPEPNIPSFTPSTPIPNGSNSSPNQANSSQFKPQSH